MKNLVLSAALACAALVQALNAAPYQSGLSDLKIADAGAERPLEGFVWYPTQEVEGQEEQHSNIVWEGNKAIPDAAPAEGDLPLLVLSHGMYGNAMNQGWLAAALSRQGYVVAAINHPGTSTWLRDEEQSRMLWERPRDISRVIDHFLAPSAEALRIDPDRIYMAGHSLGGFTAIALAGGRYDAAHSATFCAAHSSDLACGVFESWEIAKTAQDQRAMEADLTDPRIQGFAVFDLGGTQSFAPASLRLIEKPLLVYGAPRAAAGLNLETEARALAAMAPNVTYREPSELAHFDFLGVCKPGAEEILAEGNPGDEVVCYEGGDMRRSEQKTIAAEVLTFFESLR